MTDEKNIKQAVALSYNSDENSAPMVIAKGKGFIADEIINEANRNNIPIQEDPSLVELLGQLELNRAIPEELYEVVAEIFAFIYRLDKNSKSFSNQVEK